MKKIWQNMFMSTIIFPKVLDIIEVIDTTSIEKQNKTKLVKFTTTKGKNFSKKLSQIFKRSNITLVKNI